MKTQIETLLVAERYAAAKEVVASLPANPEPELAVLRARVFASEDQDDEAMLTLRRLFADPDRMAAEDRDVAFALAVRIAGWKRLPHLAARLLEQGRAHGAHSERLALAEGEVALSLDDRMLARTLFEKQNSATSSPASSEALARVCYVQGDFDTALRCLDGVPLADVVAPWAFRLRASIHSARRAWSDEVAAWDQVLALRPDGDRSASDAISRAFALAAQGRRDEARIQFDEVWRAHPDTRAGAYARARRDCLAEARPDAKRKVLDFPRVQQKRSFCGPACIELCLRSLAIDLDQDEIAKEVKRETGTPMYEIVHYMRSRGVEARRFVANDERICAAIDLGLPVILQEEYSTTSHVAVVIGYDRSLGVLIMQDPMSHRASTRPLGWSETTGQLYGCGAIVVLGRADGVGEELRRSADQAGLVEAEHLVLVDECSRRRRGVAGDTGESARAEEILDITARVIDRTPDFRLAWMNRIWALRDLWDRMRGDSEKAAVLAALYDVRTRFSEDEWPCQEQGHWYLREGAYAESFVAYLEAHRRDPGDGNNLTLMAESLRRMGRFPDAERGFMKGLENDADRGMAEWMLAALYLREVERLDAEGDSEGAPPEWVRPLGMNDPKTVDVGLSRSREDLLARAEYFNEVCREIQPDNPYHHEILGMLSLRRSDWTGAAEAFERARTINPSRWHVQYGRAIACEALGQFDEARGLYATACERFERDPEAHTRFADFLVRRDCKAEAATVLGEALSKVGGSREILVEPLLSALCSTNSKEEAAARLREIVSSFAKDEALLLSAAAEVDGIDQRGHAIAILRILLEQRPDHDTARARLGRMLVDRLTTRSEGIALLEAAVENFPHWGFARRPLALAHLPVDPAKGLAVLEPLIDDEDSWTQESISVLRQALGDRSGSERALRRALACHDDPPIQALGAFASWHMDNHRYGRAFELAQRMEGTPHEAKDVPRMDWTYLRAARLLGRAQEIVPWVRQRCSDNIPPEKLAWQVYYAYSTSEHDLAAGAAHVLAAQGETDEDRATWRIREAEQKAHLGDESAIEAEWAAASSADAWATLNGAMADLKRYDRADEAVERALTLDPKHDDALCGLSHSRERQGDLAGALDAAERMLTLYPYDHRGPEILGGIHARQMHVEDALAFSDRALDAAPYCHNAYESRALALFAAGRFEEARLHAEQALALSPEPEISDSESRMILYALGGDRERAGRCLDRVPSRERELGQAYYARLLVIAEARNSSCAGDNRS